MIERARIEGWIRDHRPMLWTAWATIGVAVIGWLLALGPDYYRVRGIAPWPRRWVILFFLALWGWVALRFIALWIWAWVVMAWAPVFLFLPLRFYLDAWWLLPLLITIAALSALTLIVVVTRELRRRRGS